MGSGCQQRFRVVTIVVALAASTIAGAATASMGHVEIAAAESARARVQEPDRLEVLSVRAGPLESRSGDGTRFEVEGVEGPNASGIVAVTFRVFAGPAVGSIRRVLVRGRVVGPAVVATRTLPAGVAIGPEDVAVAEMDLTRLRESPLRDPEHAYGLVPVRTLGANRALTPTLLGPADVVRRGQTVDLVVHRPGMTIRAAGRARRDGAPGDTIVAENLASGALVRCRVRQDGSLIALRSTTADGRISTGGSR